MFCFARTLSPAAPPNWDTNDDDDRQTTTAATIYLKVVRIVRLSFQEVQWEDIVGNGETIQLKKKTLSREQMVMLLLLETPPLYRIECLPPPPASTVQSDWGLYFVFVYEIN